MPYAPATAAICCALKLIRIVGQTVLNKLFAVLMSYFLDIDIAHTLSEEIHFHCSCCFAEITREILSFRARQAVLT